MEYLLCAVNITLRSLFGDRINPLLSPGRVFKMDEMFSGCYNVWAEVRNAECLSAMLLHFQILLDIYVGKKPVNVV